MFIDLFKMIFRSREKQDLEEKELDQTIDRHGNITRLRPSNSSKEKAVDELIQDWMGNGIPLEAVDHLNSALVYTAFDRLLVLTATHRQELLREIVSIGFDARLMGQLAISFPDVHDWLIDDLHEGEPDGLIDYIPLYLAQKRFGDLAPRLIERAHEWIDAHGETYKMERDVSGTSVMAYYACWLPGEPAPHADPSFRRKFAQDAAALSKKERQRKDPIFGGRPAEVLVPPRSELEHSFSWWSLQLNALLAPEYIGRSDYRRAAYEVARKLLPLMPTAANEAISEAKQLQKRWPHHTAESALASVRRFSLDQNQGLARYVRLLGEEGEYAEAITMCDACIKHGIHDGTQGGFPRRKATFERKLAKRGKDTGPPSRPDTSPG